MNYVVVTPYNTFCYVRIPNGRGHNDTRECIEHFCERHVSFLGARLLIDLFLYNRMKCLARSRTFVSFSKMFRMFRFCCLYFFLSFDIIQRISRQFYKTYLMYYVLIQQAFWAHCTIITFDLPITIYLVCRERTYTCIHVFAKNSIFNSSECIHLYILVYGKCTNVSCVFLLL